MKLQGLMKSRMVEVMSRVIKLEYDFNTAANLEVEYKPGCWARVTPTWFRSFIGPRRINEQPYTGPVYYEGSNYRYRKKKNDKVRLLSIEEHNDKRVVDRLSLKPIKMLRGVPRRSEKHLQS